MMVVRELVTKLGFKVDEKGLNKAEGGFKKLQNLSKKLLFSMAAIGTASVKSFIDFEDQMASIGTLIPGNTERVDELGKAIRQMARDTGTSTKDLADGMYQVVSAFGDTADAVAQLDAANRAAVAGGASTVDAINLLSAVTKGYGDTSEEAQKKASDLAFMTVKLGQTTFPELASSMGKVIPMASAMNVSQEELFAGFAALTGVTGTTAEVSTQLRGVMSSMVKPSRELSATIKSLGYENSEAIIEANGLVGALHKIIGTTGGTSEEIGKLFSNVNGLNAVMELTGTQADVFNEKFAEMQDAAGATEEAFSEKEKTTKMAFARMMANIKDLALSLGQTLIPVVSAVVNVITDLVSWFQNLPAPIQGVIGGLVGVVALIHPFMKLVGVIKSFGIMLKAIKLNPATLKFMALGAAIAGLVSLFRRSRISAQELNDSLENVEATNNRVSKNQDMLNSLRDLEHGTDEYNHRLQELIAMNPELQDANLDTASSFADVERAVNGVNEELTHKAQLEAMENYKKALPLIKDAAAAWDQEAAKLSRLTEGTREYQEQLLRVNAAKQEFETISRQTAQMGEMAGIYSEAEIQQDIRREIERGQAAAGGGVVQRLGLGVGTGEMREAAGVGVMERMMQQFQAQRDATADQPKPQTNVDIKSDIDIAVPSGTPEQQQQWIQEETEKSVGRAWEKVRVQLAANFGG